MTSINKVFCGDFPDCIFGQIPELEFTFSKSPSPRPQIFPKFLKAQSLDPRFTVFSHRPSRSLALFSPCFLVGFIKPQLGLDFYKDYFLLFLVYGSVFFTKKGILWKEEVKGLFYCMIYCRKLRCRFGGISTPSYKVKCLLSIKNYT